jgi:5-methylcytosine-specific restriction endonuclease McrA
VGRLTQQKARIAGLSARVKSLPKRVERFYQSPEWRQYRRDHAAWTRLQQGGLWCCVCGSSSRLILDHVIERKDGGADFPPYEGAKWYCTGCHNVKTARSRAARANGPA